MTDDLKPEGPGVRQIFAFLDRLTYFVREDEQEEPLVTLQVSDPNPKKKKKTDPVLAVIVGENAGGKSFVRRIVKESYRRLDTECIDISAEARRTISYNPFLVFVYGDEAKESTGFNSAGTILGAISTSQKREKPHAVFWDEPDLGMSEGWSACAGREIVAFLRKKPKLLKGAYIVTHSRYMVRELKALDPLFVYVGNDRKIGSIDEWLEAPIPEYGSLGELRDMGVDRFRKISKVLKG